MRIIRKCLRKFNNKGFSLVEVLVTIAIIGIVVVPLISTFILSTRLNINASNLQNATLLAQSISEEFKAMTVEQLKGIYGEPIEDVDIENGDPTGKLIFKNIGFEEGANYFKGAGGETFYVSVELDPNEYKNVTGINDYKIPDLSDLYNNTVHGPIVLKSQIVKYDNEVNSKLGIDSSQRKYVVKETTVILQCTAMTENFTDYYFMDCYLDITYTYTNPLTGQVSTYSPDRMLIESYTLEGDEETPPVYVCYSTFDTYSNTLISGSEDTCGATDKFVFKYSYSGDSITERDVKVYLAQQTTSHSEEGLNLMSALKISNVYIEQNNKIDFYTNVLNSEEKELTSGEKTVDTLYKMTVKVCKDADGKDVITTFDGTKEN